MKKALTLLVLVVAPALAFAQGTVSFGNQTGLVMQWTNTSDSMLMKVPRSGGYVQLIAAPVGTPLPNPLGTLGAAGFTPNYTNLATFLAANPGWAAAVNNSGAVPVLVATGSGIFNGGTFTIQNIAVSGYASYFALGWTRTHHA